MAGELSKILTGLILMSLVVVGVGMFIGGFTTAYPTTAQNVSGANFSYFDKAALVSSNMDNISTSLQGQESQTLGILETSYNIIAGAFGVIMQLFGVGDLMISLVGGFGTIAGSIGIELAWATSLIMVLILTAITIYILRAVLKWEL